MTENEKIEDFCLETIKTLSKNNILEGSYCITVTTSEKIKFIYKNIGEFKIKVLKDVGEVSPIEFTAWIYD